MKKEITVILIIKALLLFLIWFLWFDHPMTHDEVASGVKRAILK